MKTFAVIDRASNNVLGEFRSRESADRMRDDLFERDPSAKGRVEIVEAELGSKKRRELRRIPASEYE